MKAVTVTYTNYKGQTTIRHILPLRIWFGATTWHPQPQWLLECWDIPKQVVRDFALSGMCPQWDNDPPDPEGR